MSVAKIVVLVVFVVFYALALIRKIKLSVIALAASVILIAAGIISPKDAFFKAIPWDVLGVYWGFMMVSIVFMKSNVPDLMAYQILLYARVEKYAILMLCVITAFLSAFMHNVGVVLIMAPLGIATAQRVGSSLFPYLIGIAISSNVVTTVTMVADPPALILALETGMKFFDFYWFQGKLGFGTISIFGVAAALGVLLLLFWGMNKRIEIETKPEKIKAQKGPAILFILGILALALGPEFNLGIGWIGVATGLAALYLGRNNLKAMIIDFDWHSFVFITGIFIVIYCVQSVGLLNDLTAWVAALRIREPALLLALITWISVVLSSFIDNVPYTVLMIPVCEQLAALMGISPWPLLYGMLVGTGIGGNITPIGATANVFACGILEKHGYKIRFKDFVKIGLPFSVVAVATAHLLIQMIWLKS